MMTYKLNSDEILQLDLKLCLGSALFSAQDEIRSSDFQSTEND